MKEEAYVFNDGSLESKLIQYELKNNYDVKVFDVKPYTKLDNWLAEVIDERDGIIKVFLHFPYEDYLLKGIRDEIMNAGLVYPKIRVIPWYEQAHRDGLAHRAANYGINKDEQKPETGKVTYEFELKKEEFKDKRRRKK